MCARRAEVPTRVRNVCKSCPTRSRSPDHGPSHGPESDGSDHDGVRWTRAPDEDCDCRRTSGLRVSSGPPGARGLCTRSPPQARGRGPRARALGPGHGPGRQVPTARKIPPPETLCMVSRQLQLQLEEPRGVPYTTKGRRKKKEKDGVQEPLNTWFDTRLPKLVVLKLKSTIALGRLSSRLPILAPAFG